MSSIQQLSDVGKGLGLVGEALLAFIKEEQARERQMRLEAWDAEKEERVAKIEEERLRLETDERVRLAAV